MIHFVKPEEEVKAYKLKKSFVDAPLLPRPVNVDAGWRLYRPEPAQVSVYKRECKHLLHVLLNETRVNAEKSRKLAPTCQLYFIPSSILPPRFFWLYLHLKQV